MLTRYNNTAYELISRVHQNIHHVRFFFLYLILPPRVGENIVIILYFIITVIVVGSSSTHNNTMATEHHNGTREKRTSISADNDAVARTTRDIGSGSVSSVRQAAAAAVRVSAENRRLQTRRPARDTSTCAYNNRIRGHIGREKRFRGGKKKIEKFQFVIFK